MANENRCPKCGSELEENIRAATYDAPATWDALVAERDAALAQVVALRCLVDDFFNYVGGADDPRQDGHLMDRAVDALMDTSATAQQTVERIEREAVEKALDEAEKELQEYAPGCNVYGGIINIVRLIYRRAAILDKKES